MNGRVEYCLRRKAVTSVVKGPRSWTIHVPTICCLCHKSQLLSGCHSKHCAQAKRRARREWGNNEKTGSDCLQEQTGQAARTACHQLAIRLPRALAALPLHFSARGAGQERTQRMGSWRARFLDCCSERGPPFTLSDYLGDVGLGKSQSRTNGPLPVVLFRIPLAKPG